MCTDNNKTAAADHEHEVHEHDHEHTHSHEHCGHSHTHTHADGTTHTHAHTHSHSAASSPEEALALLNYMLDQSEPTVYEMVIEEKDIDRGYKSRTDYYIFFDHGGKELKMEVSSETYAAHEVGDTLPVMLYDGAFDKPYFIIE